MWSWTVSAASLPSTAFMPGSLPVCQTPATASTPNHRGNAVRRVELGRGGFEAIYRANPMSPDHRHFEDAPPHPLDIVCDILREAESLPRLMEILYLVQEPGLLEIMRGLVALPEEERFRLLQYLARHREHHMYVRELPSGALIIETVEQSPLDESA